MVMTVRNLLTRFSSGYRSFNVITKNPFFLSYLSTSLSIGPFLFQAIKRLLTVRLEFISHRNSALPGLTDHVQRSGQADLSRGHMKFSGMEMH